MEPVYQEKAGKQSDAKQSTSEAKVATGPGYDKIAELAYDSEMVHEGATHQIFFDLLDQGAQKNHINLGTGSALKAGRKYNDAVGTVNVTVGDNKDSGKKLTFANANALDEAILDALPYASTVKQFQEKYPGTKAYKNGGKAAKQLYSSTVNKLKALSGTISDGKQSATAKFTGKMGYVNIYLSDEDVAQVKKVNIDADFKFGDNVTAVFRKCLTKEADAQNVVFKGFIHGIHAYGSMPTVYKHFGKDPNNLRILEEAVKQNNGTDELVQALYKSIEATLAPKWHDSFKRVINTYIKGKGRNAGGNSKASTSSESGAASKNASGNSGNVSGNSGASAKGQSQMNAEGHPIYYPKGATGTQAVIKWNKDRNYTTDYIKAFQKHIDTDNDGDIGTNTVNAIRHYQEKNSLGQDGKWGKECARNSGLERKYKQTSTQPASNTNATANTAGKAGGASNVVSGDEKSATGQKVVDYAAQFIGHTYVWGGKGQVISQKSLAWLRKTYGSKSTTFKGMTTWAQRYDWIVENRAGERAFDCSGLCVYSYRNAAKDVGAERPSASAAVKVFNGKPALSQMKVGDVIVSSGHYQMYYGNGKAIESCSSKGVTNTLAWDYNGVKAVYRYFND